MRGSIQKKGKQWYAVVYDGVNPQTGKYIRRWVPAGTRRADAERLLADLVQRSHGGETVVSDKVTLGEYLTERWLPIQQARLRASTLDSYRRNIELHVLPALGARPLDRLRVEDVDLFYAKLLTGGRKNSKGPMKALAPKTVHNIHVMLNKAMADAYRKGTVVRNVVALADAPSLKARKRDEIKAWDAGPSRRPQLRTFATAVGDRSRAGGPTFRVSTGAGCRPRGDRHRPRRVPRRNPHDTIPPARRKSRRKLCRSGSRNSNSGPGGPLFARVSMVAGAGFEPATFGL